MAKLLIVFDKQGKIMSFFHCRYKIMWKCWLPNPKDRPSFSEIGREMKDMMTMLEHAMKQGSEQMDIQTTYVNMDNCTGQHCCFNPLPEDKIQILRN